VYGRHLHSSGVVGRSLAGLSTGALLLSAGCAVRPVDVAATRRACGLQPVESALYSSATGLDLSEECVRALGKDVGFDWEGLGQEPHAMVIVAGDDLPWEVLGGLYLLLAAPMPSIADEMAEPGIPEVLSRALRKVQDVNQFDQTLPASYLYYGLVAGRIHRLRFVDRKSDQIPAETLYDRVQASVIFELDPRNLSIEDVPGVLVHEAVHTWTSHSRCTSTSNRSVPETPPVVDAMGSMHCDRTVDGSYGAQLWYNWRVLRTAACEDSYESKYCSQLYDEWTCRGSIIDVAGFPPCEASAVLGEHQYACTYDRHLGYMDPYLPPDCPAFGDRLPRTK
jgi:hypothetical protein